MLVHALLSKKYQGILIHYVPHFHVLKAWRMLYTVLKVPRSAIFDRSNFHYVSNIKSSLVGDFGAKI